MESYKISVIGKVQGVWFRKYTQEKATKLKLTGYVSNKENGSVYIEVTGDNPFLNEFINWLKNEGSPLSDVTNVNCEKLDTLKTFTSFSIKR